ncbi:MAG: SAM-dependent chlorinase/fluorinase [Actinomycetota bacterium]|nr:SAM-dependent chlorinase/fluorinase [Actinomycetota bacterium]MDP3631314.1 SAM-dependent chlorinase/fluorinase [Actinomycetota bacterium]
MQSIICFTSDFGMSDTWVGVCHAVIYRACPQARVVDLAHDIQPYDIRKAAAVAASGVLQLPEAIHLVVVDPGVGGGRRDLCLVTTQGTVLVGPDNGVLIPATWRAGGIAEAYVIEPQALTFRAPLATFHARDVLAPAAAALACGVEPGAVGASVDSRSLVEAPFPRCYPEDGQLVAEVVDIDRFGSIRLAVLLEDLDGLRGSEGVIEIDFENTRFEVPLRATFSDVAEGESVALFDSSGWLTIAVRMGSAAERYGAGPGGIARVHVCI